MRLTAQANKTNAVTAKPSEEDVRTTQRREEEDDRAA
jgi:hypothetical protein